MSLGPVTCERADARDVAALAELDRQASAQAWTAQELAAAVPGAHHDLLLLVSYERDAREPRRRVLAYCAFQLVGDEAEIHRLVVRAEQQRRGWGRRLLGLVLARLERAGAASAWLEVRESNAAARTLYASAGFVPGFRRRGYYREPREDALVLRRALSASAAGSAACKEP